MRYSRSGSMRRWALVAAVAVVGTLPRAVAATQALASRPARAVRAQAVLDVPAGARLLVLAPHPDDETLAAGGLIQAVLSRGGSVWVVFATNGDGFRLAARRALHKASPGPAEYRRLGELRRREALDALARLGVPEARATFLGFPDRGLLRLWLTNWHDPYRSPYTDAEANPYPGARRTAAAYTGEELAAELDRVLAEVRPDLIAAPALADFHPDHKALALFARRAVAGARTRGERWAWEVRYLEYVVHREEWRHGQDRALLASLGLTPAEEVGPGVWVLLPLSPAQGRAKREAIAAHRSQTAVMAGFLYSFAGRGEVFRLLTDLPLPSRPGTGA